MTFVDILLLSGKTVICYIFLLAILKWMGKREIGKVSTFDLVVFFVAMKTMEVTGMSTKYSKYCKTEALLCQCLRTLFDFSKPLL